MVEWYKHPWSEIVKELNSNTYYGLDAEQVGPLREKYGENKIVMPDTKGLSYLIFVQFREIWIVLLMFCAVLFLCFGMYIYGIISLAVILFNVSFTAMEQYKVEKDIKELRKLNLGMARVVRDGRTMRIPSEELVVGDIVIIGRGEGIPADMRIIESNDLKIDECSVTGENFIVEKYESKIDDKELSLSDMKNMLFKSSSVAEGDGTGIVVAVGMDTQVANIVKFLVEDEERIKSFGFRMHKIINTFSTLGLICLSIIGFMLNLTLDGDFYYNLKRLSLVFLGAIPQAMIVIILLIGVILLKKFNKKNITFKDLSSIEKFSGISAVCTDKVGAFSKNKMRVAKAYGSNGIIDIDEETFKNGINESLYRMINIGLLCNDVKSVKINDENSVKSLVELSMINFCAQNGIYKKELDKEYKRVFQILFDGERRIMTTVNKVDEKYRAHVKGATDSILSRCTHILKNGVELEITEEDIKSIKAADISMSNECLYVVGFAYRNFNYEPSIKENIESNLVFVGLIGFDNMLKENATDCIKKAFSLSIKPIIITDDSKLTALAIGKKINIVSRLSQIVSGVEMDNMTDEEFSRLGEKVSFFSRISSRHKVRIIKALKSYGYMTAITGWKLTDLPSLKISDVGITNTKSKIVRKLCDVFVKNMDFMNFLNTVEDSRKIINMIKKIIVYIISCCVGMSTFLVMNVLFDVNISTGIIAESLWFNGVIMFLSALTLMYQCKDEEGDYVPSVVDKSIVRENIGFILFGGFSMGILSFLAFYISNSWEGKFSFLASISVLNICAVLFVYSFSNEKFFKNKISNMIPAVNLIIQLIGIFVVSKFMILFDLGYWKIFLGCIIPWFVLCIFHKFYKDEYV
ncbi:MAG: cation-transporting P-type ATPase [Clostridium luticellarii]|jgi:magnesium-transporting ATPase (P-type)|uniref:P-type ATPase n=1 Tax=Clostridium luticellarii TaxID=1691940 RepID=UPI00235435F1|nr:cation-transporting P-type ATPase [Clostridium luticellarii]MCI1995146.1 cation-transporting P-type ATPase [Clostridium luticellarii]MCI2039358.1 cation-transporting P-type ATPase [Clostridium luticellarii]